MCVNVLYWITWLAWTFWETKIAWHIYKHTHSGMGLKNRLFSVNMYIFRSSFSVFIRLQYHISTKLTLPFLITYWILYHEWRAEEEEMKRKKNYESLAFHNLSSPVWITSIRVFVVVRPIASVIIVGRIATVVMIMVVIVMVWIEPLTITRGQSTWKQPPTAKSNYSFD